MNNEEQLAIRQALARAQGWTSESFGNMDQYAMCAGPKGERRPDIPDPFTNAADLLALLEWAPNQKWFGLVWRIEIESLGADRYLVRITKPNEINHNYNRQEVTVAHGSLQEALPMAIYQALQEVGNASNDA